MDTDIILSQCERVIEATRGQFEKLSSSDREKAGELCYAALQRWLPKEERTSAKQWIGVSMEDGDETFKVRWQFDAEEMAGIAEGLPPGKYRWCVYPVGSSKAELFPAVKTPLNVKGAEIIIGTDSERQDLTGEAGIGVPLARLMEKHIDGQTAFQTKMVELVDQTNARIEAERQRADARYDAQHQRNMQMLDMVVKHSEATLGLSEEMAARARRAQTAAIMSERTSLLMRGAAERQERRAAEVFAEAEMMLEQERSGGLTGIIMTLLETDDGKMMFTDFLGNLGDGLKSMLTGGQHEKAEKRKELIAEAANKLGGAGYTDAKRQLMDAMDKD